MPYMQAQYGHNVSSGAVLDDAMGSGQLPKPGDPNFIGPLLPQPGDPNFIGPLLPQPGDPNFIGPLANNGSGEVIEGSGKEMFSQFNPKEQKILTDAKNIFDSPEFADLVKAYENGEYIEINVNGYKISYEPDFPPYIEGLTNFEGHGFHIGSTAFEAGEIEQTVLHKVYRLNTSQASTGVDAGLAAVETEAARNFADSFWNLIAGD